MPLNIKKIVNRLNPVALIVIVAPYSKYQMLWKLKLKLK